MGIEPYLVASSLEMVLAQRLVRVICPQCKEPTATADLDCDANGIRLPGAGHGVPRAGMPELYGDRISRPNRDI